jgi:hypothetical protein
MRESSRIRISITLIAAYVIALQALLLPLSVAAAVPFVASHCASVSDAGNDSPVNRAGCPCAGGCGLQCCTHAMAALAPIVCGAAPGYAGAATPEALLFGVVRPFAHRPQILRAPPSV